MAGTPAVAVDVVDAVAIEQAGATRCRPHRPVAAAVERRAPHARGGAKLPRQRNVAPARLGRRGLRSWARRGRHASPVARA